MAGLTDYGAQFLLNYATRQSTSLTQPTLYAALATGITGTGDANADFTEVVTTGGTLYARATTTFATAASGSDPSTISNSAAITFPQAGASWGTVVAFGLWDNQTVGSGNLWWWDWLGADPWFPFTAIVGSATTATITAIGITAGSSPALANAASVVFDSEWGGTLPTGLTKYTSYTVSALSNDVFCPGVATTATGSGLVRQIASQLIPANITFSFAASALTLSLT